jgi:endonuclease YncB( thermonuclease family)
MVKILFLLVIFSHTLQAEELKGSPKIIDGDTIYIKSIKIRLEGIDAPEMKQKCKKPYLQIMFFTFQKDYLCGQVSKKKTYSKN